MMNRFRNWLVGRDPMSRRTELELKLKEAKREYNRIYGAQMRIMAKISGLESPLEAARRS